MANKKYIDRDKLLIEYFEGLTDAEKGKVIVDHFNRMSDNNNERFWECEYIAVVYQEGDKWICVDNRSGDCWVDEFDSKEEAELSLDDDYNPEDPLVINMLVSYLNKKLKDNNLNMYEAHAYENIRKFIKDKEYREDIWRIINE